MLQEFAGSPTLFSGILKQVLKAVTLSNDTVLVQYVDDLLIASKDCNICLQDTKTLSFALAEKGHTVSLAKMQLCQRQVRDDNSAWGKDNIIRTNTGNTRDTFASNKQTRAFLSADEFNSYWIPGFGEKAKPLITFTKDEEPDRIAWTLETQKAFKDLKQAVMEAPSLALPTTNLFYYI